MILCQKLLVKDSKMIHILLHRTVSSIEQMMEKLIFIVMFIQNQMLQVEYMKNNKLKKSSMFM